MIIDTHAHINDSAFSDDREQIISNLQNDNISKIITVSYDLPSIKENLILSEMHDNIFCALGVHPENANEYNAEIENLIFENKNNTKFVAVGEIGMDYHYQGYDKQEQKKIFIKQIMLAKKLNLPIIIHVRDCIEEAYEIIKENKNNIIGGVMHCFSGSIEMAQKFVDLGLFLGIGGVLTFTNARKTVEVIEKIDLKYILLETDCPYLCPKRGERNEPKYTNLVAKKIAEIKNMPIEEVERITNENAKKCFSRLR